MPGSNENFNFTADGTAKKLTVCFFGYVNSLPGLIKLPFNRIVHENSEKSVL